MVVGGGGGTKDGVGAGTDVLVLAGSGTLGVDAESTMNAIATINTAITAAAASHHRDQ